MPSTPSTEAIQRAARALFDERVGAVTALADATRQRAAKQAEAAEAQQREAAAWTDALRHGWTEDDLKAMGLVAPARKPTGRTRSRRRAAGPTRQHKDLLGAPGGDAANAGAGNGGNAGGDDAARPAPVVGG